MKKIVLSSLVFILFLQLNARENPFEETNAYEEEAARIIEQAETEEEAIAAIQEAKYVKEIQENKVDKAVKTLIPALKEKPKEKTYSQKEVKKLIKKAQIQSEVRAKNLIKKELKKVETIEPKQIVYVKPRADIIEEEKEEFKTQKILPFIDVMYNDDKITIDTKYKVLKKFAIDKENKIIIDYKAKINFYTKRMDLTSKNFLKIAVGNHKNKRYFRVVLKLPQKPDNYNVDYENNLITIVKRDKM